MGRGHSRVDHRPGLAGGQNSRVNFSIYLFPHRPGVGRGLPGVSHRPELGRSKKPDSGSTPDQLRVGNLNLATDWLRDNVQCHGALKMPSQTISDACGFEPSEVPLLAYLQRKFSDIYDL